ncbi:MAG: trypsin-like peptidase domain-containing protein [Deinococcus sp.]
MSQPVPRPPSRQAPSRRTLLLTAAVIVGLGLGASVLRGGVPVSDAQDTPPSAAKPNAGKGKATGAPAPLNEGAARLQNEANTMDIVKRFEPGLVYVSTEQTVQADPFSQMRGGGAGGQQVQEGVGSGFFVNAAGDILTNFHVVRGANKIQIRLLGNKQTYSATVIGRAPQYDLALIRPSKLPAKLIHPIPLGDSGALQPGQKAVAMGAPFGLDFSVTEGIVSATNRRIPIGFSSAGDQEGQGITQNAIQTDAAINPGNSGGPLLNSAGQVIGINTQILSPAGSQSGVGQNAGVGFAIPINTAKNLLPRLQQAGGKEIFAPRIGVQAGLIAYQNTPAGTQGAVLGLGALNDAVKKQLGLPGSGLVIAKVTSGSPAERAGVKGGGSVKQFQGGEVSLGGDVIVAVDGQPVDGLVDVQAALIDKVQGNSVTLTLSQGGKKRQAKVTLDASAFK